MPALILDGRRFAALQLDKCRRDVAAMKRPPLFAAVLVGDDAASALYVRLKERACREAGVSFERHDLPAGIGQAALLALLADLNARPEVDAVLLQLPLPEGHGYDVDAAVSAIDPLKDVDGFHPDNVARLKGGHPLIFSPLVAGIMLLLRDGQSSGPADSSPATARRALVIANSPTFYEPLAITLPWEGYAPSFRQPDSSDIDEQARAADAVIVAVGRPGFLRPDMVKPGATVIDVGTNRVPTTPTEAGIQQSKTVGDAAPSVAKVAGRLSPVPGGVGPMTVAMVVTNAVTLAQHRQRRD